MDYRFTIVGAGEALFDIFPDHQTLGGAPVNAAVHAHQLSQGRGGRGVVLSRVGQDELGEQIIAELRQRGMNTDFVQTDPDRDTGRVYVEFDASGRHRFQIVENVAWDVIQFDFDTEDLAQRCDAVCFGTLAQRDAQSRNTIYRFLDTANRAVRLFDVNLRQNYYDARILSRSCERATIVKLNDEELPIVCELLGLAGVGRGEVDEVDRKAQGLLKKFDLKMVAFTRGERGTVLHTSGGRHEGPAVSYRRAPNADPVGAGDACAAAILVGTVLRFDVDRIAALANHAGGYVASQAGATPPLPQSILDMVK